MFLQHLTLLPSPLTSTTECSFCFVSISSFLLELFLRWSPVAYWPPTNLGSSSFSVISFCFFILLMWGDTPLPRAEKPQQDVRHWSGSCAVLELPWEDTPCPRPKVKPQQDGSWSVLTFRIEAHIRQRCSEDSNRPCAYQDPETTQRLRQNYIWVSQGRGPCDQFVKFSVIVV